MDGLLELVAAHAGKPAARLTRRDVARWLVATPHAAGRLVALRRTLADAGLPLSPAFWESAQRLLERVADGDATFGDVRRWIEATGSEPTQVVGLLVWGEEGHRLPVADRMHRELVAHLEDRVRAGAVDPDRLLVRDPRALAAYVAEQERWLAGVLPGGSTRADAILDEEDQGLLEDWAEADAESLGLLDEVLDVVGERPCPTAALGAVCDRLRSGLTADDPPYDLLASCAGLRTGLPEDDRELWLTLAAGVVDPREEPPDTYDSETLSAWAALMHADWLCAVSELARTGPGAPSDPEDLAEYVTESDVVDGELTDEDEDLLTFGFIQVVELWRTLAALDREGRLTPLGWWGLPEALRRAWAPSSR